MESTDPPDASLRLSREQLGTTWVVHATGEVDVSTAPQLRHEALPDGPVPALLVLEFTGVTFLDSAGLTVLVQLNEWCREHEAAFKVVTRSRAVLRTLQITALDRILTIVATLDDALPTGRQA
ncbi:anti-sigma factor antagonist [Amycolatopsis sp. NBC_00345]|uniref:anti-sigma factor antagonist n=1 Tax=Amycolatopsis sp. NBC_00345 TaxID=2975955 RepID=UPI002E274683|nr:anti-sigma factor antagonist [Amycolatopsis sp. NBC_00345]